MQCMATFLRQTAFVLSGVALVSGPLYAGSDRWIWVEAESATATNFPQRTWFSPANEAERSILSGGAWLTNEGKRAIGQASAFAEWKIPVKQPGLYDLWARKMWKHGPFRFSLAGRDGVCGRDVPIADSEALRTHVPANWVWLGQFELSAAEHTLRIELLAGEGEALTAGFDCFCLTREPFLPRGKLMPGDPIPGPVTLDGVVWEAYDLVRIPLAGESPIDLRWLNEPRAGEHGPVRARGEQLLLGDGQPVRFVAVNVGMEMVLSWPGAHQLLARRLSSLGVNMVRVHGPLWAGSRVDTADPQRIAGLQHLVAALADEGIYTTLSPFFPAWLGRGAAGIPGGAQESSFGSIFLNLRVQTLWKTWLEQALTAPNPHRAGKPLGQDPALAMVELVNEDSLLFWTFARNRIAEQEWAELEAAWSAFVATRYSPQGHRLRGSPAGWKNFRHTNDRPDEGHFALHDAWHFTQEGVRKSAPGAQARMQDQLAFLAQRQKAVFEALTAHLRGRCGYHGLVIAGNWKTADDAALLPAERATYLAGDLIDQHGYFQGTHTGDGSSFSVRAGQQFTGATALERPDRTPLDVIGITGRPHLISELMWNQPNPQRTEFVPLALSYAALQGVDGVYLFAAGSASLVDSGIEKFQVGSPAMIAMLPAAALAYRRADIREGPVALQIPISADQLHSIEARRPLLPIPEDPAVWVKATGPEAQNLRDRLAWLAGPVRWTFGARATDRPTEHPGLKHAIDLQRGIYRSLTDELVWNRKQQHFTLATPRAAGWAGILQPASDQAKASGIGPAVRLGPAVLHPHEPVGSVVLVSLDGQPLGSSRRMLLAAASQEQPTGWHEHAGQILQVGGRPMRSRAIRCELLWPQTELPQLRATALGWDGLPAEGPTLPPKASRPAANAQVIPITTAWTLLER